MRLSSRSRTLVSLSRRVPVTPTVTVYEEFRGVDVVRVNGYLIDCAPASVTVQPHGYSLANRLAGALGVTVNE